MDNTQEILEILRYKLENRFSGLADEYEIEEYLEGVARDITQNGNGSEYLEFEDNDYIEDFKVYMDRNTLDENDEEGPFNQGREGGSEGMQPGFEYDPEDVYDLANFILADGAYSHEELKDIAYNMQEPSTMNDDEFKRMQDLAGIDSEDNEDNWVGQYEDDGEARGLEESHHDKMEEILSDYGTEEEIQMYMNSVKNDPNQEGYSDFEEEDFIEDFNEYIANKSL